MRLASYGLAGLLLLTLSACTPSLSPLYRDYEIEPEDRPISERIEGALEAAGWQRATSSAPNVIATEARRVRQWGLYSVIVSIEAVPVGTSHVRVYFHPYRKYFTGSRSKIPFLKPSLRRALLKDLNQAFEQEGLLALDTAFERDRQAVAR